MKINRNPVHERLFGYARVSTKTQHEDRQVYSLGKHGVKRENLFVDKSSGKDFNRPQYQRMLRKLREGDVLFLPSIDRLGRNYDEIIQQWQLLTKEKKIQIVILDMPLLDTRKKSSELIDTFVADLVLQIMSYVAQNEREMMKRRQQEGIDAARRKGTRFGRPRKLAPPHFSKVYHAWKNGKVTLRAAAEGAGVCESTFKRWGEDLEARQIIRDQG